MTRLNFALPDFTRLTWVSEQARELWEPRVRRIASAWAEIEWKSIVTGLRKCAVVMKTPEEFLAYGPEWAAHGLNAMPLEMQGISKYGYANTSVQTTPGEPFVFRIVIGSPKDVAMCKRAFDCGDDTEIGELLGYPSCCLEFFRRVWVEEGMVDTTWPMAVQTDSASRNDNYVNVDGPPQANILWRWMGVRPVPHLPCRFDCSATVAFADEVLKIGREAGYTEEMDWLMQILGWPIEWSALHGIAEIKTPILKVSTTTDATATKYIVQKNGASRPEHGAIGLSFPFSQPRPLKKNKALRIEQGFKQPITKGTQKPAWYASDNGFSSIAAMELAHEPIIELVSETLDGRSGNVLDLGCGNGALLRKLHERNPAITMFGLDMDPMKITHAKQLNREFEQNFVTANMFDCQDLFKDDRRYILALLMPGRLMEVEAEERDELLKKLRKSCHCLIIYAYSDWLQRYHGLEGLINTVPELVLDSKRQDSVAVATFS